MNTITDEDQLGPLTTKTKYQDQVHTSDYNLLCVYIEENSIIPRWESVPSRNIHKNVLIIWQGLPSRSIEGVPLHIVNQT